MVHPLSRLTLQRRFQPRQISRTCGVGLLLLAQLCPDGYVHSYPRQRAAVVPYRLNTGFCHVHYYAGRICLPVQLDGTGAGIAQQEIHAPGVGLGYAARLGAVLQYNITRWQSGKLLPAGALHPGAGLGALYGAHQRRPVTAERLGDLGSGENVPVASERKHPLKRGQRLGDAVLIVSAPEHQLAGVPVRHGEHRHVQPELRGALQIIKVWLHAGVQGAFAQHKIIGVGKEKILVGGVILQPVSGRGDRRPRGLHSHQLPLAAFPRGNGQLKPVGRFVDSDGVDHKHLLHSPERGIYTARTAAGERKGKAQK